MPIFNVQGSKFVGQLIRDTEKHDVYLYTVVNAYCCLDKNKKASFIFITIHDDTTVIFKEKVYTYVAIED
jgi:hypothetical protein